jgi:poly-gamma-glutamate synthesis protein (capsule biosynthesis protein)
VKIAFLSYTYGTNGLSLPSDSELYVPYINQDNISRQIESTKNLADLVFVSVHWGEENHFAPSSSQTALAQTMADWGADVIIGHHPHVVQPIEWIQGENGNKTLCIYSLGNLISAMNNGYNMLGGLMTFDIVKNSKGEIYIDSPLFIPTAFYYADSWFQTELFLLENYDQKKSLTHGSRKHGKNCTRTEMEKLLTQTIDREFLPQWLFEVQ